MIRTVKTNHVKSKAVKYVNGVMDELDNNEFIYQGRALKDAQIISKISEKLKEEGFEGYTVVITESYSKEQKYFLSLSDFIKLAQPVDENFKDKDYENSEIY